MMVVIYLVICKKKMKHIFKMFTECRMDMYFDIFNELLEIIIVSIVSIVR